jgi:hypothetical protein
MRHHRTQVSTRSVTYDDDDTRQAGPHDRGAAGAG